MSAAILSMASLLIFFRTVATSVSISRHILESIQIQLFNKHHKYVSITHLQTRLYSFKATLASFATTSKCTNETSASGRKRKGIRAFSAAFRACWNCKVFHFMLPALGQTWPPFSLLTSSIPNCLPWRLKRLDRTWRILFRKFSLTGSLKEALHCTLELMFISHLYHVVSIVQLPPYLRSPYIVLFSFMTWARSWRAEKHSVSRSGFAKFGWIAKNTMAQMSSRG